MIIPTAITFNSCKAVVPGIQGVDAETSTIIVDQGAVPPDVEEWLNQHGISVKEIDALEESINKSLDEIHVALKEIGNKTIPGSVPGGGLLWQVVLLYLFGSVGIRDGKGLAGKLAKTIIKREEKKNERV